MEQITPSVEPQEFVISFNGTSPSASYALRSSMHGSRVEVIIEDGNANSSQVTYDSRLCRNVEVRYSLGEYFEFNIPSAAWPVLYPNVKEKAAIESCYFFPILLLVYPNWLESVWTIYIKCTLRYLSRHLWFLFSIFFADGWSYSGTHHPFCGYGNLVLNSTGENVTITVR